MAQKDLFTAKAECIRVRLVGSDPVLALQVILGCSLLPHLPTLLFQNPGLEGRCYLNIRQENPHTVTRAR